MIGDVPPRPAPANAHSARGARRPPAAASWAAAAGAALALAGALGLPGCYYLQAAAGQARVLLGRVPIERALAEVDDLQPLERELLAEVPEVLGFAEAALGLRPDGSYRTFYDTGAGPVSWNVTACPKTRLEPYLFHFPIIGAAPYKGFFDEACARAEAARLAELGLDVRVGAVSAYSTLGWFEDPVYRSMLRAGRYDFVSTLIHETAHATIFREGDAAFNESMATFVGEEGGLAYLRARYGDDSPEVAAAQAERRAGRVFARMMSELYAELEAFYARGDLDDVAKVAGREPLLAAAKLRWQRLCEEERLGQAYAGFAAMTLDNCFVMMFRTYNTELDAFAQVHVLCDRDWERTLAVFAAAARAERPFEALAEWRYQRSRERLRDALAGAHPR